MRNMRSDNKAFDLEVLPTNLLDSAIGFIQRNLDVTEVFPESDLIKWAEQHNYVLRD